AIAPPLVLQPIDSAIRPRGFEPLTFGSGESPRVFWFFLLLLAYLAKGRRDDGVESILGHPPLIPTRLLHIVLLARVSTGQQKTNLRAAASADVLAWNGNRIEACFNCKGRSSS